MASTHPIESSRERGLGRIVLWVILVLALVVGSMFLVVGLTNSGDTQTGGYMVALPCAIVAALCATGLKSR